MEVVLVNEESEFEALASAWDRAAAAASRHSVFLRHSWFRAAWAWRRRDCALEILVARDGERVLGLLPLVRSRASFDSPRLLELLAVPDTQACDLIAPAGDEDAAAELIAASLARRSDWDLLNLDCLEAGSLAAARLSPALARHGIRVRAAEGGCNTYVAIEGAWDDYYGARPRSLKKANNLAANRLTKSGSVRIDWITSSRSSAGEFRRALDTAIDISSRSWKGEMTCNSLDQPGPQAFIRALSDAAYAQGWLSLWMLYLDDEPLAMEYQIAYEGNVYALRSDFDARCTKISPGSHLLHHLLERLFEGGYRRYYMGRGQNPYKAKWADAGVPLKRVVGYNATVRGRFEALRDRLTQPMKDVRDRLLGQSGEGIAIDVRTK